MGEEEKVASLARLSMTRRVLLTAGGLTLLAVSAPDPASPGVSAAPFRNARRPGTRLASLLSSDPPAAEPTPPHPRKTGPRRQRANTVASHRNRRVDDAPMTTIDEGHKAIALTIDDGPNPIYTPQVL